MLVVERAELRPAVGRGEAASRVADIGGRFALIARLRRALEGRGYAEADTPLLLESAGTDPFIDPIPARLRATWNPVAPAGTAWLHTSPELELKRLLALGFPAIYQITHVFRQGDLSPWHEPEFAMAEWYRVGWGAEELAAEVVEVVCDLLGRAADSVAVLTIAELCEEHVGVDVLALQEGDALARRMGWPPEPFVHAFSRLWVERVEPALADRGVVLLTRWPAALGMLARCDPGDSRVALRFELLVDGVELANGFEELTDPVEQRARFEEDLRLRAAEGRPAMPMPERFLAALEAGVPPCAGVALGVDRLAALAVGRDRLAACLASPAEERFATQIGPRRPAPPARDPAGR
ncbi:MAG: EF-P lysine aminoacylase GenX [Deltaproteobacteria bacterium]|nr:MAG: EF-P lysine aminoacylase GenX [Deltaproteobacteria bacterium]